MIKMQLQRLGMVMEREPGNSQEVEGVMNPAVVRGPDGALYLFPRLVARGNYSRIGIARVRFNEDGDPCGVERLGIALEPEADYELRPGGAGGCEDPRITFVEPLQHYVMTYTAFSPRGPRIALAISEDLFHWQRLGLVTFEPYDGIEFDGVDNKDSSVFPATVLDPSGHPALAILHRPLFPGTRPEEKVRDSASDLPDLYRESIWISYRDMAIEGQEPYHLCHFTSHTRLASLVSPWELLKIGVGTPPILTSHGNWLILYHGVSEIAAPSNDEHHFCYAAGMMILAREHPQALRYRSEEPVLTPELPRERRGIKANVVFPTGIDRRDDLGLPNRFDVYYGMADNCIGVARLNVPAIIPPEGAADPPKARGTRVRLRQFDTVK
jgi:predicted GH43/DUF377 family glycosyl hydrolase